MPQRGPTDNGPSTGRAHLVNHHLEKRDTKGQEYERHIFYNQRGTAEQRTKEGKGAIKWARLSCRTFAANAVRLQLHALAYNLAKFMRTLAMPKVATPWSLTSLRERLIKIGAKIISHDRYVTFQWPLCRYRHKAHYAEVRIMPHGATNERQ